MFERASEHTVADLAPHPETLAVESAEVALGLSSPLAIDLRDPPSMDCVISRSALWYLADRDGLGAAAAYDARHDDDSATRVLSALLMGAAPDEDDIALSGMGSFVKAVTQAWQMPRHSKATDKEMILAAARSTVAGAGHPARIPLVAEVVAYRLDRHPHRLVPPHLRFGPVVATTIEQFVNCGVVGLWPAQAEVLGRGLLQDPVESFIVQLATSAGKTLLVALSCAVALDQRPDRQVVVVASTGRWFGNSVENCGGGFQRSRSCLSSARLSSWVRTASPRARRRAALLSRHLSVSTWTGDARPPRQPRSTYSSAFR